MKKLFFLSLSVFSLFLCFGQEKMKNQIFGKVTDAKTGGPLAGASIFLPDLHLGTSSDSTGAYVLENISGHVIVEISFSGYKSIVEHLDISETGKHDFALSPSFIVNEGITVTAVGGATSIRKAPIPITKVSKTELLSTPSTNIIDALTRQPGVSQLSTGPAISKPIIRGLGYNRLVVINDGVRQEGQQWGDEHGIEIDENNVSRVEIVKGPASLIYGSDAMAGVINIITTTPLPVNTIKGSILSSYQTNNKQRSLFGNIGGNHDGFTWNAWGDYKAAADYKNKYDGPIFNSKFNEHNFGANAGLNGAWGFSHFIVSSFNQRLGAIEGTRDTAGNFVKTLPNGIAQPATATDFNSTAPQIPYQNIQHLKFTSDNNFKINNGKLSLTLAWQQNQRKEFGNADDPQEKSLHFDLKTFNYNAIYHLNDKNGWNNSIGVTGMAQNNKNKGVEVLIPEYNLWDIGAFVYSQKTFGKVTTSGGIRYDHRSLDSHSLMEDSTVKFTGFTKGFSNFSGSAGLSYAATEKVLLKLNIAHGFRAPSVPELASNGAHEGTNRYEYGNSTLHSEISWQGDAGIEFNSDHILFTATAFYNRIHNFIFYSKLNAATGSDSLVNVHGDLIPAFQFGQRDATLYGGEVLVDIHPHPLDWLHWENTLSYVRGQFADPVEGTRNVPLIPAPKWVSELRGSFLKNGKTLRNLSLHGEVEHNFAQNNAFTAFDTETSTPGYTLINAGVSTDVMNKNKTLFSIYFMGTNLSDVAYQNHLSRLKYTDINPITGRQGVFNTGRNFMVKINVPLSF